MNEQTTYQLRTGIVPSRVGAGKGSCATLVSVNSFFAIFAAMNVIKIDSLALPELEPYARLTEAQLRNRLHASEGLFICESAKVS